MAQLVLSELKHVPQEEFEKNFPRYLRMLDAGDGPVIITREGKSDLIIFLWDDYWERFGCLYSIEEIEKTKAACREYAEKHPEEKEAYDEVSSEKD